MHFGGTSCHPQPSPWVGLAHLFVLAQNPQPILPAAPKSELAEWSVGTSSIFGSSSSLSPLKINHPSCPVWFATDPPSDPTLTTKENRDDVLSVTWLPGHCLILSSLQPTSLHPRLLGNT